MAVDDVLAGYLESGAVDEAALRALPSDEQTTVRRAVADLDRVRLELADGDGWSEPAPDLEQRVLDLVLGGVDDATAEARSGTVTTSPASATGTGTTTAETTATTADTPASLADARLRRSRFVAIGASLVAVAAIVVAVVALVTRPATTGPSGAEFALASTDLVHGASGTVHLEETGSGVRIYLDATGLPRRDHGQFYEAWAKTAHGMVSIGTFHTGADVVLWSGVSIAEIDAITVTLEDDDGNPASSGQRVLIAQLH